MGAGDAAVVGGGDGYGDGDGVVGVAEMLEAVMVAVALILDSWWS